MQVRTAPQQRCTTEQLRMMKLALVRVSVCVCREMGWGRFLSSYGRVGWIGGGSTTTGTSPIPDGIPFIRSRLTLAK